MSYKWYCINTRVNLIPLEGDNFDPNEAIPLYLDTLKVDTLQLHSSYEESRGEKEEIPTTNLSIPIDGANTEVVQEQ